jgi:hypothetical protein
MTVYLPSRHYYGRLPAKAIDGPLAQAYRGCLFKAREAMRGNPLSDRTFLTTGFEFGEKCTNYPALVFWPLDTRKNMNQNDEMFPLSEVEFLVDANAHCWLTALVLEVKDFDLPSSRFQFQRERLKMRMNATKDPATIVNDMVVFTKQLAVFALLYSDLKAWTMRFTKSKFVVADMDAHYDIGMDEGE